MKKYTLIIILLIAVFCLKIQAQNTLKIAVVGFYNTENLFDTINDPNTQDEEFLPNGQNQWTSQRYWEKINNLSKVISSIGKEQGGAVILGLSEIENRHVLEDLVNSTALKPLNYGIVHHDSPDLRGIDVAFIYQKDRFKVLGQKAHRLISAQPNFITRDQVLMVGVLDNTDTLYVTVNHWPSKRGGEKRSYPRRVEAASLAKAIKDSILNIQPNAKIILMGDLNDNPNAKSIVEVLGAKSKIKDLQANDLFNPMWKLYQDGIGSYAYRDSWELIDQILVSYSLINSPKPNTYHYKEVNVFRANYLFTQTGSFAGYPFRTYAGGAYQGGYSDHLPVYIVLQR